MKELGSWLIIFLLGFFSGILIGRPHLVKEEYLLNNLDNGWDEKDRSFCATLDSNYPVYAMYERSVPQYIFKHPVSFPMEKYLTFCESISNLTGECLNEFLDLKIGYCRRRLTLVEEI